MLFKLSYLEMEVNYLKNQFLNKHVSYLHEVNLILMVIIIYPVLY